MTKLHLIAAAAAASLAVPAAAQAASIEHTAGTGPANEEFLVYRAGRHEKNRLTVTSSKNAIVFTDPGAPIHRKPHDFGGCKTGRKHRHRVVCKVPGYTQVVAYLGDSNDSIRFKGGNGGKLGKRPRTEVT